jgi:hypothetical protein
MLWGAFVLALTLFKTKNFAPTTRVHYCNQMPNPKSKRTINALSSPHRAFEPDDWPFDVSCKVEHGSQSCIAGD